MSWLETKYITLVSNRLQKFKRKGPELFNFRCPFCLDSEKNQSKARGYIYQRKGKYLFHCHNCSETQSFNKFLKNIDDRIYSEYVKESLVENGQYSPNEEYKVTNPTPIFKTSDATLKQLKKVTELPINHPARQYITTRQLPNEVQSTLYYCSKFRAWTNSLIPDKFESVEKDEPRIIIPLLNEERELIGYQGRSLDPNSKLRYISIMLDTTCPRIYGMERISKLEHVYAFEGPFDAMFIPNSIASAGGEIIAELRRVDIDKPHLTVVYDNEPRNVHTVGKMIHSINEGYKVCIWPPSIEQKDINDMVLKEIKNRDIDNNEQVKRIALRLKRIIDENTFEGPIGLLHLNNWKKV